MHIYIHTYSLSLYMCIVHLNNCTVQPTPQSLITIVHFYHTILVYLNVAQNIDYFKHEIIRDIFVKIFIDSNHSMTNMLIRDMFRFINIYATTKLKYFYFDTHFKFYLRNWLCASIIVMVEQQYNEKLTRSNINLI